MCRKFNGEHIKALREKAGYKTLAALNKVTGISLAMLSSIETGHKIPSPASAELLKTAFQCTFDDIFLPYDFTDSEIVSDT